MANRNLREILLDPQIVTLAVVFAGVSAAIYFFGLQLAPFFIAVLFAYFLDAGVTRAMARGLRRRWAVALVFVVFLVVYVAAIAGPLQVAVTRSIQLASEIPRDQAALLDLVRDVAEPPLAMLPEVQRQKFTQYLTSHLAEAVDYMARETLQAIPKFTGWLIYLFLIPLLVFFFLKDKESLLRSVARCLPKNRQLVERIWAEMEVKMGNYVRGKVWEILIVAVVTWAALALLGFRYPVVLGALSGISVLVPFVGAIGVAVPVFLVAYAQWGLGWDLGWVMIAYTVIQMLDGNVLVPYIFSEAVKLHPVVILLAVLIFGSLWGVMGVFFAIPLATLFKSLMVTVLEFRERAIS